MTFVERRVVVILHKTWRSVGLDEGVLRPYAKESKEVRRPKSAKRSQKSGPRDSLLHGVKLKRGRGVTETGGEGGSTSEHFSALS